MRSSLSHNVCRQLVACHVLSAPVSSLAISSHASLRLAHRPRPLIRHSTRRTFLNKLFNNPPREILDNGLEPGFGTFLLFHDRFVEGVKLPDREELIASFKRFFEFKLAHKRPVNRTEAYHARLLLDYLSKGEPAESKLVLKDLQKALASLTRPIRRQRHEDIAKFASALYKQIQRVQRWAFCAPDKSSSDDFSRNNLRFDELCSDDMKLYLDVLTRQGASQEAARILASFEDLTTRFNLGFPNKLSDLHMMILRSLAKEEDPSVEEYAKSLISAGFQYFPEFHEALTTFYASPGQLNEEQLQQWFEKPIENKQMARPESYLALIKYSAATGTQPPWLMKALQDLCELNPPKEWWDIILQWAVYQGKDIVHLKHMINVLARLNQHDENVRADITTINGLLTAALDNQSVLLAERIYALASELELRPNTQTYTLLLRARIAGNDSAGAASTFEDILHSAPLVPGSEAEEAINQYIRYLCSGDVGPRVIVNILSRVERQRGGLDPETVVAVCSEFLKSDEPLEVMDTLSLHLKRFGEDDRRIVQKSLEEYSLDKKVTTARAWDCYNILRQFFPELGRTERVGLMNGFFDRKRPDLGTHIFGRMRAHQSDHVRPDLEAYIACFEGLGAHPDEESIQFIHNMLKTDTKIQPCTRLYNALMLAYMADGQAGKAYEWFLKISNSSEGPSYASLEIVFRTCAIAPDGYERAKAIWDKLQRLEVELPLDVYDAYILMMAGRDKMEDVKNLLTSRQAEYKAEPTASTLGHVYNAFEFPEQQQAFKDWASLEFPDSWKELAKTKLFKTLEGTDRYLIPPKKLKA